MQTDGGAARLTTGLSPVPCEAHLRDMAFCTRENARSPCARSARHETSFPKRFLQISSQSVLFVSTFFIESPTTCPILLSRPHKAGPFVDKTAVRSYRSPLFRAPFRDRLGGRIHARPIGTLHVCFSGCLRKAPRFSHLASKQTIEA